MARLLSLFAVLVLAVPAHAQDDASLAQTGEPPQRTSILYTYGDDPCPEAQGDEIVVCAQRPESERYRVPKELRKELQDDAPAGGGSWASRVEGYENIARVGRPNSCSAVGSNGWTGCTAALIRDWFEAKRADGR
jgi:hypothetical protein